MADYDVIVIGSGPAGQKAAIKCAKVGRKVALVDNREVVGGQCLHIGTIPSKTLRAAIIYLSGYFERKIYGSDYRVKEQITIEDLIFRCNSIIAREIAVINHHLQRNGIEVLIGHAEFLDDHRLSVNSSSSATECTADNFIITTGSISHLLQELPFDGVQIMNTDDILKMSYLPKKLVMIGGGVIGLEYACMFSLLEIEVLLVTQYDELLPWVDRQLVHALIEHMQRQGVEFKLKDHVAEVEVIGPHAIKGTLESGEAFDANMLLYAAQRWGNTLGLGLDKAGVKLGERDQIVVDDDYRTSAANIFAAGDVIGFPSLASTSIDQGRKAANRLLGVDDVPYEPIFPYGIYTFPDVSMVGASEHQLDKDGRPYETGIGYYRDSARGQILGDDTGLVKLIFDPDNRDLLGVHIIGSEATELIHIGQAVMINGGKIDYFIDTVFNYPTLAEVYKIAALNGFNKTSAALPHFKAL